MQVFAFFCFNERWIKYINKKETKHLYKFDGWLKRKEINWNNLPNNIDLKTTYKYFQQKFSTITPEQSTTFKIPPSTIKEGPTFTEITTNDVIEALKRMKSKSCGPDHISLDTIRLIDPKVITECFNNCYSKGDIPNEWKKGYIKIIPKKDKVETHKYFRPITIMNIMYRLLFNIIQKKISRWAKTNINIRQQAFTPGRQPNNHCVLIQALKKIYKKKGMIITNIDIAGAYDAVEFRIIEIALDHAKFPADLKNFILNSYKNNEISIEWNDILSEPFKKTRGIPQGCPLAPLIFNIITQMIIDKAIFVWKIPITPKRMDPNDIGMLNFADDMTVLNTTEKKHNHRLKQITKWLRQIHLEVNPSKCISSTIPSNLDVNVVINGQQVPKSKNQRILKHESNYPLKVSVSIYPSCKRKFNTKSIN